MTKRTGPSTRTRAVLQVREAIIAVIAGRTAGPPGMGVRPSWSFRSALRVRRSVENPVCVVEVVAGLQRRFGYPDVKKPVPAHGKAGRPHEEAGRTAYTPD